MKRLCLLIMMTCMLPSCAAAQWYLFPGKNKAAQTTVKDTARRAGTDSAKTAVKPGADSLRVAADTLVPAVPAWADAYVSDIPDVIHIGLALPIQATGKASENFLDFYSGALLALRDLGTGGLRADLQVFDTADGKTILMPAQFREKDLFIGPVPAADVQAVLQRLPEDKVLVSPLDPKTAEMAAEGPVVQSPSPWTAQIDELVRWVREDLPVSDEVYVIRDTAAAGQGAQSAYLMERLQESRVRYKAVNAVRDIPFSRGRKARVFIASDRDSFFASAVRSLSIEGALNDDVVLYGTARVRANGTGPADLHNTMAHLAVSYFIDYEDPAVRKFILAYRALFQNEPGSFAFQGYDTMHYFVNMCSKYGRQWYKKLPEYKQKGLQADFRFTADHPRVNQAVRRVIYNKDLTTTCQAD